MADYPRPPRPSRRRPSTEDASGRMSQPKPARRKRPVLPKTPSRRLTNEDANMRMSQPRPARKKRVPSLPKLEKNPKRIGKVAKPKLKHPSWGSSTTTPYAPRPVQKRKVR